MPSSFSERRCAPVNMNAKRVHVEIVVPRILFPLLREVSLAGQSHRSWALDNAIHEPNPESDSGQDFPIADYDSAISMIGSPGFHGIN